MMKPYDKSSDMGFGLGGSPKRMKKPSLKEMERCISEEIAKATKMVSVVVWYYWGQNDRLRYTTAGVATSESEAINLASEWCDVYQVSSKELTFTEELKEKV